MDIATVTIPHPCLNNREITILMVDGKIDTPSTEFFIYEARYGGRHGSTGGKTSHSPKAFQMAELYRNLDLLGLNWENASESDIKKIRNAMLCWDSNDTSRKENFSYEPISNDSMNHKLNTWFKFYVYMEKIGRPYSMVLSTKKIKKFKYKGMLDHLNKRYIKNDELDTVDRWTLMVKPSPKSYSYHALTRVEFSRLRKFLRDIDIVYEMIALLMVETGLRRAASLEATEEDFRSWLKYITGGKTLDDVVKRKYIPKGGDEPYEYDLPIRVIVEINESYLMREFPERLYRYEKRSKRLGNDINNRALWITKNGKEVKKHDINDAFVKASEFMGRKEKHITPHWLRHTFATWTLMDIAKNKGIPLENTGATPNPLFILALQQKLGHADASSTMRYIATALKLMGLDLNDGPITISLRTFKRDKKAQEYVKDEAVLEFGERFDDNRFEVIKYALSRNIVINDELVR